MIKLHVLFAINLFSGLCYCQSIKSKESFLQKDSAVNFIKINSGTISPKLTLQLYPNPAKNKISLLVTGFEQGLALVKILDAKGKLVRQDSRLLANGQDEIMMFLQLQPGVYYVSVSKNNRQVKKKLMVL